MGGQSFKCPVCEEWKLMYSSLREHVRQVHRVKFKFNLVGVGSQVELLCVGLPAPPQPRVYRTMVRIPGDRT